MTFTKEQRIQQLQDACDSIKENAADFIGDEPFPCNWIISIVMNCKEFTTVKVERECIPHIMFEKIRDNMRDDK